jgi:hypothetical protein
MDLSSLLGCSILLDSPVKTNSGDIMVPRNNISIPSVPGELLLNTNTQNDNRNNNNMSAAPTTTSSSLLSVPPPPPPPPSEPRNNNINIPAIPLEYLINKDTENDKRINYNTSAASTSSLAPSPPSAPPGTTTTTNSKKTPAAQVKTRTVASNKAHNRIGKMIGLEALVRVQETQLKPSGDVNTLVAGQAVEACTKFCNRSIPYDSPDNPNDLAIRLQEFCGDGFFNQIFVVDKLVDANDHESITNSAKTSKKFAVKIATNFANCPLVVRNDDGTYKLEKTGTNMDDVFNWIIADICETQYLEWYKTWKDANAGLADNEKDYASLKAKAADWVEIFAVWAHHPFQQLAKSLHVIELNPVTRLLDAGAQSRNEIKKNERNMVIAAKTSAGGSTMSSANHLSAVEQMLSKQQNIGVLYSSIAAFEGQLLDMTLKKSAISSSDMSDEMKQHLMKEIDEQKKRINGHIAKLLAASEEPTPGDTQRTSTSTDMPETSEEAVTKTTRKRVRKQPATTSSNNNKHRKVQGTNYENDSDYVPSDIESV